MPTPFASVNASRAGFLRACRGALACDATLATVRAPNPIAELGSPLVQWSMPNLLFRSLTALVAALVLAGCVEGFEFDDIDGQSPGPDACDECVRFCRQSDGSTDASCFNECVRDVPECSLCLQPFFEAEDNGASESERTSLFCDCVTSCPAS